MAIVAAIFATGFYTQWDTWLRFHYGGVYGLADPVFGVDLGFYMFRLPWYELLQNSLVILTVLAILAVASQYAYFGLLQFHWPPNGRNGKSRRCGNCRYCFSSWPAALAGVFTWIGSSCFILRLRNLWAILGFSAAVG